MIPDHCLKVIPPHLGNPGWGVAVRRILGGEVCGLRSAAAVEDLIA
jgi:hypothetical protein